ncbi:MAG: hypothetical protein HYY16_19700 [Planctomycetes bacterium]|nr:hypothetical protein [Planctomycetota bacterium]
MIRKVHRAEGGLKPITLRNLPPELARTLLQRAREKGWSLNKTVIAMLEEAAGIAAGRKGPVLHHDLDALAGSWSAREAAAFDRALAEQRVIDPDLWK